MKFAYNNKILVFIVLLWCIIQLTVLKVYGIGIKGEAAKYIEEAIFFLSNGRFKEPKYLFYSLPILVIALSIKITGSYKWVVLIQIVLNGLATRWLYKATLILFPNNKTIKYLTTLLFISFFPIQQWNTYLYTESIFMSITVGLFYLLIKTKVFNFFSVSKIVLALILCILSRPSGIILIPSVIIYLLSATCIKFTWKWVVYSTALIIVITSIYYLANYAFKGGGDLNIMKPFIEEHIICFVPTTITPQKLFLLNSGNALNDLFFYITHNPYHFFNLTIKKMVSFFNFYRNYYSVRHNIYLIIISFFLYGFTVLGYKTFFQLTSYHCKLFILSLLIIYPCAIALQCDDYHSRFTIVICPYIMIIASVGMENLLIRTFKQYFSKKIDNT